MRQAVADQLRTGFLQHRLQVVYLARVLFQQGAVGGDSVFHRLIVDQLSARCELQRAIQTVYRDCS